MKTKNRNLSHLAFSLTASLLLAGAGSALAQFASPVGTWDCVISGRENGVAFLKFNSDNTLSGYEVLTPKNVGTQTNENLRGGDNIGRTGDTSQAGSGGTTLGFTEFTGNWTYDYTGKKVLGFFSEVTITPEVCTTHEALLTMERCDLDTNGFLVCITIQVPTNYVVCTPATFTTNSLSFSAIVKPGIRLSMKVFTQNGNRTLKGVPAGAVNFSGDYYAEGKKNGVMSVETFSATSSGTPEYGFDIIGQGGGGGFNGIALPSIQKKVGLVYFTNPQISLFGSINYSTRKASLKGFDSAQQKITYKVFPLFTD